MNIPVSVMIPTFNERENIAACIRSVRWSNDIVVVDSDSTDGTAAIAQDLGARVVQFNYHPGGLKKKNWALENVDFRHPWILILDADERVTPELSSEIGVRLRKDGDRFAGYYVARRFYFLGRWIRWAGYYPSWNLRLIRRGRARYEFIPDDGLDSGDNEVHEHVLLDGRAGYLRNPLDHFAYPSIKVFVEKHNRYSNWEARVARQYLASPLPRGQINLGLRLRRRLKKFARQLPMPHWLRFFYHYVLRLGFLDGVEGYVLCHLLSEYEFLIWAKSWEAQRNPTGYRAHREDDCVSSIG